MNSPALNLLNVKAIALAVTDLERAMQFYTDTLSLRPAFEAGKQVGNHLGHTVLLFKTDSPGQPSAALGKFAWGAGVTKRGLLQRRDLPHQPEWQVRLPRRA